jgi:hypothetical protein
MGTSLDWTTEEPWRHWDGGQAWKTELLCISSSAWTAPLECGLTFQCAIDYRRAYLLLTGLKSHRQVDLRVR